jgi:glycosyltransferase involved in cell wall biosynthesis
MVIAPAWGGQLDFLNENNSLLVSGKEMRADPKSMYWEGKNNAICFNPNTDEAADKLKQAYSNYEIINANIDKEYIFTKYSWDNIAHEIIKLCVQ